MTSQSIGQFFGNENGLRRPRLKNYLLHFQHRLGLRRFRESVIDVGSGVSIAIREGTHDGLIVKEIWEDNIYPLDSLALREGDLVIDVGAQIGSFSLLAAARGARVLAFEPCPMNLRMLRANVERNGMADQIQVHPLAVSRCGVTGMRLFQSYTNLGGHSSLGWVGPAVDVKCTSLPEILKGARVSRCRALKVDAEGAEGPILFSAGKPCLERIDLIFAEVIDHPAVTRDQRKGEPSNDSAGVMSFLEEHGFEVQRNPTTKVVIGRNVRP